MFKIHRQYLTTGVQHMMMSIACPRGTLESLNLMYVNLWFSYQYLVSMEGFSHFFQFFRPYNIFVMLRVVSMSSGTSWIVFKFQAPMYVT